MNIKSKLPLLILSAAALASCSAGSFVIGSTEGETNEIVTVENAGGLYTKALENAESIENEEPLVSEEESSEDPIEESVESSEEAPSEEISEEESIEEVSEEEPGEEPSEEEPSEEAFSIRSYHIDYTSRFAFKASISDYILADESEVDTYTLDYENDEEAGVLMHATGNSVISYFGEEEELNGMDAFYQGGYFYTTQSIGEEEQKIAYSIDSRMARKEFGDYFVSVKDAAMIDETSDEANAALVEQLLASENVKIVSDEDGILTISFDYEEGTAEISIDKEHRLFTRIAVDFSSYGDALKEHFADSDLSIDEYSYTIEINVTYNSTDLTPLSEEEIAEYTVYGGHDYGHHSGHDYGHHGHHDDHDEDVWNHGHETDESEEEPEEEHDSHDHGHHGGDNDHGHHGYGDDYDWGDWDDWGDDYDGWDDWGDDSDYDDWGDWGHHEGSEDESEPEEGETEEGDDDVVSTGASNSKGPRH